MQTLLGDGGGLGALIAVVLGMAYGAVLAHRRRFGFCHLANESVMVAGLLWLALVTWIFDARVVSATWARTQSDVVAGLLVVAVAERMHLGSSGSLAGLHVWAVALLSLCGIFGSFGDDIRLRATLGGLLCFSSGAGPMCARFDHSSRMSRRAVSPSVVPLTVHVHGRSPLQQSMVVSATREDSVSSVEIVDYDARGLPIGVPAPAALRQREPDHVDGGCCSECTDVVCCGLLCVFTVLARTLVELLFNDLFFADASLAVGTCFTFLTLSVGFRAEP